MNWLQFAVQWLHVLLGILWFGYALSMYFLVSPGARHIGPLMEGIKDTPDYPAAAAQIRRVTTIDLGLFFVVFTCMILMRFGL